MGSCATKPAPQPAAATQPAPTQPIEQNKHKPQKETQQTKTILKQNSQVYEVEDGKGEGNKPEMLIRFNDSSRGSVQIDIEVPGSSESFGSTGSDGAR